MKILINLRVLLVSILIGLLTGVIAGIGDLNTFDKVNIFLIVAAYFNTATVWSLVAFFVGTLRRSRILSIMLGVITLTVAVLSYYIFSYKFGNRGYVEIKTLARASIIWISIGIPIGGLFGYAGSLFKYPIRKWDKIAATVLVSAIIVSENGYSIYQIWDYFNNNIYNWVYVVLLGIGLLIPVILLRKVRDTLISILLSISISAIGIFAFDLLYKALRTVGL